MGFVSYIYVMIAWALWCTLHSLLITPFVTQRANKRLGEHFRFYRLAFNTFSLATLIPVYLYSLSIRGEPLFRWEGTLLIVRYLLLAIAIYLLAAGARHYSMFKFAGIDQIRSRRTSATLAQDASIDTTGILGAVRHPWYAAVFLILWAQDLNVSRILINLVLTVYVIVGTCLEERKLVNELGDRYRDYRRNVSMFFPYRWIKSRLFPSP
jgi:methanethiol S-methyltransferase